ncbi:MAG: glycosyltransferase [Verrucomicrobiia bacterium]
MLYLDVTSSCKSPMNTGVQRMVRGMFAGIGRRLPVTPLLWNPKLNSYCHLSESELRFLTEPFARHRDASAKPESLSASFPWSKTVRHLRHRKRRVALDAEAKLTDILVVPEIFQDNRIQRFRASPARFPGRSYAVFHDAIALRLPEMMAPERQRNFPDYICALASLDKVFCVSREVEADLHFYWNSHGVTPAATAVLGWPTDFGEPRPTVLPNFGAKRILCVATLERRKNHLKLLEAAEKLWSEGLNFRLFLVGRMTADWGATVLSQVDRLVKRGRALKWLRHVSDHALHQAYRDCSFTVYPSLREGFGLPILESLWHGRPCVCGANGALGEVSAGGGCLPVACADTESLADGMRQLLVNADLYDHLFAEASRRSFRSWDDYTNDLLREIGAA